MSNDFLTKDEHLAIDQAARLAETLARVVFDGAGRTTTTDLNELLGHIHVIQHAVMAQAAARAYPEVYRLLGADGLSHEAQASGGGVT